MPEPVQSLLVRDPSGVERVIPLDRDVFTVGRDPACSIRIDSPYVSRQHARIERRPEGPVLVDLGSRNGSLLNGHRAEGTVALAEGDVITIADSTIECLPEKSGGTTTRIFDLPSSSTTATSVSAPTAAVPPDMLRVDGQTYEVWMGDQQPERRLSNQEFELLRYLYEHRERVCTRDELGNAIWGEGNWDPNMLHRLVYRLKDKLEPSPEKPRYVQTVPWVGYRVTP